MKTFKAVAIEEPYASHFARGELTAARIATGTAYRGEIVIVSAAQPHEAVAQAMLVDVMPVKRDDGAPDGYLWQFSEVTPIQRRSVRPRAGLFDVRLPEAMPDAAAAPESDGVTASRIALSSALRVANMGLRNVAGSLRELARFSEMSTSSGISYQRLQAIVDSLCMGVDQLITEMIRTDASWDAPLSGKGDGDGDESAAPRTPRLDVLLVDDEPKMARGLARSLSTDHDVRVALSKQEAIDMLQHKVPDILLCDYRIEWQSAEDLLAMVRDRYPKVRRILYSFSRVEIWCDLLRRNLIDAAIPKSASKTEILATLM